MRAVITILALAGVLVWSPAHALEARRLTATDFAEDLALLRAAIEQVHPGFGRYTAAALTSAQLDALAQRGADGIDASEFFLEVSRILADLRCDHTLAELPQWIERARIDTATHLPFSTAIVEGRLLVDRVHASAPGLERGDEILTIDTIPTARILDEVAALVPVDGFTDATKPAVMTYDTEFLGGAIDHFFGFLYGWSDRFEIEFRRGVRPRSRTTVAAIDYPTWQENANPGVERFGTNFDSSVELEILGSTAILSIGTFVNYRNNTDVEAVLDPCFERLRSEGIDRLVIDLRSCGGGSADVPLTLLRYLLARPFVQQARPNEVRAFRYGALRPHLTTWDERALDPPAELFEDRGDGWFVTRGSEINGGLESVAPFDAARRFDGELVVLCGPANASGATNFMALLAIHRDVTFVGQPTGGSVEGPTAGLVYFLTLPNSGIRVRIPWFRQFNAVDVLRPGRAIVPDVWIEPTLEEWQNGGDLVLDWVRSEAGRARQDR